MTRSSADAGGDSDQTTRKPRKRPLERAVTLLDAVLRSNALSVDEVAEALMVKSDCILEYRSGERTMPLEVRLLLVALTIERVPAHRRIAHQLRAQIQATLAYASGQTVAHMRASPKRS